MFLLAIWFSGPSRSGKTDCLIREFCHWWELSRGAVPNPAFVSPARLSGTPAALCLAANESNRRSLADRLTIATQGTHAIICKTPLGFITDEVWLFWPLVIEALALRAKFPLKLRPETEQKWATVFFRAGWPQGEGEPLAINEYRWVRRLLDLLQLAGASGIPPEDIPQMLLQGQVSLGQGRQPTGVSGETSIEAVERIGATLLKWRQWCLERGFLSYGLIYELYWRYLLPNEQYQPHLCARYQGVFADDVDDYPAIARDWLTVMLDQGAFGVFTANPDGQVRLGLNADPHYLMGLAARCEVRRLDTAAGLAPEWVATIVPRLTELDEFVSPLLMTLASSVPTEIQAIQTTSRAQLLRQTAEAIAQGIELGRVKPEEIAIIAPGLDEIARYTLLEILQARQIPVIPLNEQRPLISTPLIRALLTLLGLGFPGLGRWVKRDDVAEMLVVLSQPLGLQELETLSRWQPVIDPVRAGLLADYCFHSDIEQPHLLAIEAFGRWDRFGHRATQAYQTLFTWLTKSKAQCSIPDLPQAIAFLEQAIEQFIGDPRRLPYGQLSALRELMETVQHYQEVQERLQSSDRAMVGEIPAIAQLIQLLRQGTITANPRPIRPFDQAPQAVTLATIFQYRSSRCHHRWQFWLDASSELWLKGGAATLLGAPLFLKDWSGRALGPEDEFEGDYQRLGRILRDLFARVDEQLFLCHSELDIYGVEQAGPLAPLVTGAQPIDLAF